MTSSQSASASSSDAKSSSLAYPGGESHDVTLVSEWMKYLVPASASDLEYHRPSRRPVPSRTDAGMPHVVSPVSTLAKKVRRLASSTLRIQRDLAATAAALAARAAAGSDHDTSFVAVLW